MKLAISFDYDSPEGYRNSFGMTDCRPDADQQGADVLLRVLKDHEAVATFGVVGRVALDGAPPEHCPEQIRQIHRAGHEIASHSMRHRFIPPLRRDDLLDDVSTSRRVLEQCIGAPVHGFIPPFNRPMHFPQRRAFSMSEMLGLHGRGRARQSLGSMLRVLKQAGFGWSRVSYEDKVASLLRRTGLRGQPIPPQPFVFDGIVAIPLHSTGFGEASTTLLRQYLHTDLTIAIYGHPNQALEANDQSAEKLSRFLDTFDSERARGLLHLHTMAEVCQVRMSQPADEPVLCREAR
jgi:peptidoglycan/xylan/chitin deacetylase (PgdA/CDA1 family)